MLRRKVRHRILRFVITALCLLVVTAAAAGGAGKAYAYLSTLARSQIGEANTAGPQDILKVEGAFDLNKWAAGGESGIKITNITNSTIWVFFDVKGSLRDVVKHISPVGLNAGQTYEIPLEITNAGELGILGWQNQKLTFSGTIIASVLNNFSLYQAGNIEIPAESLFAKLPPAPNDTVKDLAGIKVLQDVINLIKDKNGLLQQVNQLLTANAQLQQENNSLSKQIIILQNILNKSQPVCGGDPNSGTGTVNKTVYGN